jgi:replicative DNA helicase
MKLEEFKKDYYKKMQLISLSENIKSLMQEESDLNEAVNIIENKLLEINGIDSFNRKKTVKMVDIVPEYIDSVDKGNSQFFPIGIPSLDNNFGGICKGDLVIIAARPSMGKSALMLNIMDYVGKIGRSGLVMSLEMSRLALFKRTLALSGGLDYTSVRNGNILKTKDGRNKMNEMFNNINNYKIYVNDSNNININELNSIVKSAILQHGIEFCIVDYLTMLNDTGKKEKRHEVGYNAKMLKSIGKKYNIPMIALAQVSGDCEKRTDKRPIMADLAESSTVEHEADIIMFVYRDCKYNDASNVNDAELIVRKFREGDTGTIDMFFDGSKQIFIEKENKMF